MSKPMIPSAKQPCLECPFRVTNEDTPAPQGWYDKENFERIWASVVRDTLQFPCHMFDAAENTGYDSRTEALGLRKPVDLGLQRECAGITAMIHREIRIAATHPTWESYIAARPTGLQRERYLEAVARVNGEGAPLTAPADPTGSLVRDPSERVDVDSPAWKLGDSGVKQQIGVAQRVLQTLGMDVPTCECRLCTNHTKAHAPETLVLPDGKAVDVDAALHPLLVELNAAGVRTTDSCQDMHGAMRQLWPEQIPFILAEDPNALSFAPAISRREAVVRFRNQNMAELTLIESLRFIPWLHLVVGHTQAQVTFPLERLPELVDLASQL